MPIRVSWGDDERTVLLHTCSGVWDVDDYLRAMDTTFAMLDTVPHPVDLIVDFTRSTSAIPNALFETLRQLERVAPPNLRCTLHVRQPPVLAMLVHILRPEAPRLFSKVLAAETLHEARTLLAHDHSGTQEG